MMEEPVLGGLGRCSCAFWLAVAFDACGLVVLLAGVFADIFFYDFLIYAGAIVIFLSLIWWVFWYTGNIEVPPEELEDDVGLLKKKDKGITGVLRRFSSRIRGSPLWLQKLHPFNHSDPKRKKSLGVEMKLLNCCTFLVFYFLCC
ncbi:hypothetical protein KOW79_001288 [Hemibagrus wyckioides]|uniref:Uncharacterized protein n=1 Tax=Hemibagrus wyckioides TaxID=337641 RepID=A0A9D3P547_9TELE|nr:hypothetical protein KOW79_001288 [Hemibagrus wyckioides]